MADGSLPSPKAVDEWTVKWAQLVRYVRELDEARARRRAAAVIPSGGEDR